MQFLLLVFLITLLPPAAASQVCEKKNVGRANIFNLQFPGCGKGPGWAGVKPKNSFKRHNFGKNTDTYELGWSTLVIWPECVNKLQLLVDDRWMDVGLDKNHQNPMKYEVPMPGCNQVTKFDLALKIFFPGFIPSLDDEKCIEVTIGSYFHKNQTIEDFLYVNKYPHSEQSGKYFKIWWENIVKQTRCLDRVDVITKGDISATIYPSSQQRIFQLPRKCKAQTAIVKYFFNGGTLSHSKKLPIERLLTECKTEQKLTSKRPLIDSETFIEANKKEEGGNFFADSNYKNTYIICSCVAGIAVVSFSIVSTIWFVKRKRRIDEENTVAREDLNPVYGVYYSGEAEYSTVTDTNALYEQEGGEEDHNIVRDNNSQYGNTN